MSHIVLQRYYHNAGLWSVSTNSSKLSSATTSTQRQVEQSPQLGSSRLL